MNNTNISTKIAKVSGILQVIGSVSRMKILLAIGAGEACVCNLEETLGYRQAYISQQLMVLREAGLLDSRREGRYIFYSLVNPEILELFENAAKIARVNMTDLEQAFQVNQCVSTDCLAVISDPLPGENA
jgi:ArsR family transcriptional regulator